jgi:hypothetical protein
MISSQTNAGLPSRVTSCGKKSSTLNTDWHAPIGALLTNLGDEAGDNGFGIGCAIDGCALDGLGIGCAIDGCALDGLGIGCAIDGCAAGFVIT